MDLTFNAVQQFSDAVQKALAEIKRLKEEERRQVAQRLENLATTFGEFKAAIQGQDVLKLNEVIGATRAQVKLFGGNKAIRKIIGDGQFDQFQGTLTEVANAKEAMMKMQQVDEAGLARISLAVGELKAYAADLRIG